MTSDVLVCLHGYHQMDGGRDQETVLDDRLTAVRKTADAFRTIGADVSLVFLGGHGNDAHQSQDDAADIHQYTAEHHPDLLESYPHDRAEGRVGDTREDIVALCEFISESDHDPEFVISVSSKDHVSRIHRLWAELQNTGVADNSYIATAIGSEETYAANGLLPFILEAAEYEAFFTAFNHIWEIDSTHYNDAAADVQEALNQYN